MVRTCVNSPVPSSTLVRPAVSPPPLALISTGSELPSLQVTTPLPWALEYTADQPLSEKLSLQPRSARSSCALARCAPSSATLASARVTTSVCFIPTPWLLHHATTVG